MRAPSLAFAALAAAVVASCRPDPPPKTHPLVRDPAGATVVVELPSGERATGELLAADSVGLVVREPGRIVRIPVEHVRSVRATKGPRGEIGGDAKRYLAVQPRLMLRSRYPQGIGPELERRLLDAYGFAEVEEVGD